MSSSADSAISPGYRALTSGVAAWVDPDRAFVRVEGARADRMLDGLLSADVAALRPGDSTLSFILTARGRPIALPNVIRLEKAILLDLSQTALPGLLSHFGTYLPPRFASVTLLEEARRVSLIGPEAAALGGSIERGANTFHVPRARQDGGGVDLYVLKPDVDLQAIESAVVLAGGAMASPLDFEVWRIEHGILRYGHDVTDDNLPQETGLVARAASFEKGCYTGQEVVARIQHRGHVNRHLLGIRATSQPSRIPPQPGAELVSEGRVVGTVTSSCTSPRFGTIGLAYVRREMAPGAVLQAGADPTARYLVSKLPFTSM